MSRRSVSRALRMGLAIGGLLMCRQMPVGAEGLVINSEASYEVTYAVSQHEARTVKPVHIVGVETIGSREFLVIEPRTTPQTTRGYILLERISAILPVQLGGVPVLAPRSGASGESSQR